MGNSLAHPYTFTCLKRFNLKTFTIEQYANIHLFLNLPKNLKKKKKASNKHARTMHEVIFKNYVLVKQKRHCHLAEAQPDASTS